jgi:hypothetical protein
MGRGQAEPRPPCVPTGISYITLSNLLPVSMALSGEWDRQGPAVNP